MLLHQILKPVDEQHVTARHHSKPECILIDVGGTSINVFFIYSNHSVLRFRHTFSGKKRQAMIDNIVCSTRHKHPSINLVVGLPGPVKPGQDYVYCPPLGTTVDYKWMINEKIHIVNDAASHALFLLSTKSSFAPCCIITIGTSLGISTASSIKDSDLPIGTWISQSVTSYELAHEPLINYSNILRKYNLEELALSIQLLKFALF